MAMREMTDAECAEYAARVKKFRKVHGLSQARMSVAAGLGWYTVCALENGVYKPFPRTVEKIEALMERYAREAEREVEGLEGLS